MLSCGVCGTPAVAGAKFCFACGAALHGALGESDAERRIVTVLFGDLSEFTSWAEDLDPERVGAVTDRVLAALARAVTDVGGHVDKLTGDGIMAVFGAPVTHEDDPVRAVRAAAAMQSSVRRVVGDEGGASRRLGLRVGLNTGEVLAGTQANLSYTVVGDTVNTAARLSDSAGVGAVVAGREAALSTLHVASWRALPPMRLKGKREPVEAYELVALRSAPAHRPGLGEAAPYVGRESEMGRLVDRFLDARDRSTPASVVVTGEPGVGKTRLLQELGRLVEERFSARVLWGRCAPYGEGRDLGPVLDMVRTACGVPEGADAGTAVTRVRRTVARLEHPAAGAEGLASRARRGERLLADRLVSLLGYETEGHTGPVGLEAHPGPLAREAATPGEATRNSLSAGLDAAAELLRLLAQQSPLVLCIDDLHWATPGLVDALVHVGARVEGPVLVAVCGRSDLMGGDELLGVGGYPALPDAEPLILHPLDDAASERLLQGYLGGGGLDVSVRQALLGRAQGNPFFLAELLNLLVDRGNLRRYGGVWQLVSGVPDDVLPAGVHAVLSARIDGLDPDARSVLRDAAVLGVRFPVAGLPALGHGLDQVLAALTQLVERHIVQPVDDGSEPPQSYAFVHTLARDVAYAAIPKGERARRHALAAQWALADAPGPPEEVDSLVATQADRALSLAEEMGLPPTDLAWAARLPGFTALVRLAQAALARDDNQSAVTALRRALALGTEDLPATVVTPARVAFAEALAATRELSAAEEQIEVAMASDEPAWRSRALVVLGDVRRKQARDEEARECFVRAMSAASDAGLDGVVAEALRQLGLLDYRNGRMAAADEHFTQALRLARQVGDRRGVGWALQHLAWSATTRGSYQQADDLLADASRVFLELSDSGGLSWCAGTEAFVRLLQGRLREARALTAALLPDAAVTADDWSVAALLTIGSLADSELGAVHEATAAATRAHELFVLSGDSWGRGLALYASGVAARAAGEEAAALRALEQARELSARGEHPLVDVLATVAAGLVRLSMGDLPAASEDARRAEELCARLEVEPHALAGARVLAAQVARASGHTERALEILTEVDELTSQSTLIFPRRQALAHLAGALIDLDRLDEAGAALQRALATPAEDVRSPIVALRVSAALRAHLGDVEGARSVLQQALQLAETSGPLGEVAPTVRALDALWARDGAG